MGIFRLLVPIVMHAKRLAQIQEVKFEGLAILCGPKVLNFSNDWKGPVVIAARRQCLWMGCFSQNQIETRPFGWVERAVNFEPLKPKESESCEGVRWLQRQRKVRLQNLAAEAASFSPLSLLLSQEARPVLGLGITVTSGSTRSTVVTLAVSSRTSVLSGACF